MLICILALKAPAALRLTLLAAAILIGSIGARIAELIIGVSGSASHRQIEICFEHLVDVVRFESFSNLRRQIRSVIDESGRSHRQTSDGTPQLIVTSEGG